MQTTSHILMIRPVNFSFNAETAVNNAFQSNAQSDDAQEKARAEFDRFVGLLQTHDIDVTVVNDTPEPYTPDSIFPNNWVSFHEDGKIVLYPMFAPNRRAERKPQVLEKVYKRFKHVETVDLSSAEAEDRFLEGTGSLVLDRENRIAYACLSPRTDASLLEVFSHQMNYDTVSFHATDSNHQAIYHTNVMMCVASNYAVICLDSIPEKEERKRVVHALERTKKTIVPITLGQMNAFAGNMLQVQSQTGEKFLVMSSQAYESLTPDQVAALQAFNPILHSDLRTIETNGGGSARCMMAEIFLPPIGR